MKFTRITIIRTNTPERYNVNELLQWFGGTLGLFNPRDKDRSSFRIFIVLLKDLKKDSDGLSSDEIAELTDLSRGTVVHHLNKLSSSGLIYSDRNKYHLKVSTLKELVRLVQKDVNKSFDELSDVGDKLDKLLGLE